MRNVLIVAAVILLAGMVGGFFLPKQWHVEREVVIQAPRDAVFAEISHLPRWDAFTPWTSQSDVSMKRTFDGEDGKVGASMSWRGEHIGNGQVTLTAVEPSSRVAYEIAFDKGARPGTGEFRLIDDGGATKVIWLDQGDVGGNPIARYFVPRIAKFVANDLEHALQRLKTNVEATAPH